MKNRLISKESSVLIKIDPVLYETVLLQKDFEFLTDL